MATDSKVKQRRAANPKTMAKPGKASNVRISDKSKPAKSTTAPDINDTSTPDAPPKKSRKRAVDYFHAEEVESSEGKGVDKGEKPKKKAKTVPDSKAKPSKVDGHPIETEKTYPGGDMVEVEVEPVEAPNGKKSKSIEKGTKQSVADEQKSTKKSTTKVAKPRKTEKNVEGEPMNEELADIENDTGEGSEAVTTKPPRKTKKAKDSSKQNEPVATINVETPSVDVEVDPDTSTKEPNGDAATAEKAPPSRGRKAEKAPESGDASIATASEPKKGAKTGTANPAEEMSAKAKVSDSPEASKKPERSDKTNKAKGNSKDESDAHASKSKKRKTPADADVDAKSQSLVDQLGEPSSASKKARTTRKGPKESVGSKIKDVLYSGVEAASQGASATKDYIGDLANGAQTSIMSNVTEVASATVDVKNKGEKKAVKAKSLKKGKGKARGEGIAPPDGPSKPLEPSGSGDINLDGDSLQVANGEIDEGDSGDEDDEAEEDDRTAAFLKGFESSEDENLPGDEGFVAGKEIPKLPKARETAKKLKGVKAKSDEPGVVYVGRIPHGFYEHEMRAYFSQFGPISRLRLSRNKSTGRSKHYAFLEFSSADVAKIVADTMNNYLMFGHLLRCALVPREQIHENLWIGANKRFKKIPRNRIEGRKLEMGMGRPGWEKRIEGEKKRREAKMEKMKEIGYEFEAGELKGVDEVPVRETLKVIEDVAKADEVIEQEKTVVIEGGESGKALIISEEITTTKVMKSPPKNSETKSDESSSNLLETAGAGLESALTTVVDTIAEAANAAEKAILGCGDAEETIPEKENEKEKASETSIPSETTTAAVEDNTPKAAAAVENVADTITAAVSNAAETVAENVVPAVADTTAVAAPKTKTKEKKENQKPERKVKAPKDTAPAKVPRAKKPKPAAAKKSAK